MSNNYQILKFSLAKSSSLYKQQIAMSPSLTFQDDLKRTYNNSSKTNSNNNNNNNTPPSNDQLRKVIKSLESLLIEQKQKRKDVQQQLKNHRQRAIYKQNQFKKILQKLGYLNNSQKSPDIQEMYNNILNNFDESNQKALQILQKKYQQNCYLMDRRCSEIIRKTHQQLQKVKKLSQEDFQRIKRDIQDILFLAKYLQDQNTLNKKKISVLQYNNKILVEERAFILQDLIVKKKVVSQLSKQLKKGNIQNKSFFHQNLNLNQNQSCHQSVQKSENRSQASSSNNYRRLSKDYFFLQKNLIKHENNNKQDIFQNNNLKMSINKKLSSTINMSNKFIPHETTAPNTMKTINSSHLNNDRNTMTRQSKRFKHDLAVGVFTSDFAERASIASSKQQKYNNNVINNKNSNNNNNNPTAFFNSTLLNSNHKIPYKRSYKKASPICINNNKNDCSTIVPQMSSIQYQQTIKHLKLCFERQKKRRIELGTIVSKLQNQNQQINDAIEACLKKSCQSIKNYQGDQNALQTLIKSQKLYQVIRDIKKRLATVQPPSLNCGWLNGLNEDHFILNQLQKQINPQNQNLKVEENQIEDLRKTYTKVIQDQ